MKNTFPHSRKGIEIILALRLEFSYSKDEILQLYSSHAPFGGNVVGLETASWRYFKKAPVKSKKDVSWWRRHWCFHR